MTDPLQNSPSSSGLRLRRILVTTDFSGGSKRALPWAVELARRHSSALDLLHVHEPPLRWAGTESVILLPPTETNLDRLRDGLSDLARNLIPEGIPVTPLVRSGKPVQEILAASRERHVDLIILATHGYSGIDHFLMGSVAERVVRQSPCPVLVVREDPTKAPADANEMPLRHILVATDLSECSEAAFTPALELARTFGARLTLLNVVPRYPVDALIGTEISQDTQEILLQQAAQQLDEVRRRLKTSSGPAIQTEARFGIPAAEITQVAAQLTADLIIVATHGHTGLVHAYLGSVAERVVQQAHCPVLVVPSAKA